MNCPKCNCSKTQVKDSRSDDKCVYRKRVCKQCGTVFYTTESIDNSKQRLRYAQYSRAMNNRIDSK